MCNFRPEDYTIVICAYKDSIYLEECICSLKKQKLPVHIIMVTSTPNQHIEALAEKYQLEYYVNTGRSGIAEDWNFGYHKAKGQIVTIAHQDDIYEPEFTLKTLENINRQPKPLIAFTDYGELRNGERVTKNRLLKIKRVMLVPLRSRRLQRSKLVRRRILAFGSPICCPSVTYVKPNLPQEVFTPKYRGAVDWQTWERLSKRNGAFIFCRDILMFHRIHEESATTAIIADNDRTKEDYEMFCKFWPEWAAKILEYFYSKGEKSNQI